MKRVAKLEDIVLNTETKPVEQEVSGDVKEGYEEIPF
jgi:hypothetical protein